MREGEQVYHEDEDPQLIEQNRQCQATLDNNKNMLYRLFGQEKLEAALSWGYSFDACGRLLDENQTLVDVMALLSYMNEPDSSRRGSGQ